MNKRNLEFSVPIPDNTPESIKITICEHIIDLLRKEFYPVTKIKDKDVIIYDSENGYLTQDK